MRRFGSVFLAATALAAARGASSLGQDQGENGSAVAASCLAEFNTAREKAGLEAFTAETVEDKKIPIETGDYVKAGEAVTKTLEGTARSGTYAYAPQTGSTADCSAAVSFWKEAHVNFQELPTEYKSDNEGLYAESRNRSLVALFNPNKNATVDCAYFTCPLPTTTTTTASTTTATTTETTSESTTVDKPKAVASEVSERQGSEPATAPFAIPFYYGDVIQVGQQDGPSVRRLETTENSVMGLVCLTNPAALVANEKPFR
ncbi:SAG family member [Eimeria brunetti]|uniref:SAG family member n=1 Tax=Eimeria brunetti TaxID=51314 RepID=U6LKH0_9EIME|nr:SAG family member [Eimeria brunetti]